MDIGVEKQILLPWIIIPPDQGESSLALLVSAPDGTMMEFPISAQMAEQLPEVLSGAGLWRSVFESLLQSLEHLQEVSSD